MIREFLKNVWKVMKHRLFLLLVFVCLIFWVLISRVFELQIVQGQQLANDFSINIQKTLPIEGTRGNIYDRNGVPLATNELAYTVMLDDSTVVEDRTRMIHDLVSIIVENGNQLEVSFPIIFDEDGALAFSGSNSSIARFKREIFGVRTLKDEQAAMTPEDMVAFIREEKFDIPVEEYTDEEALRIMAVKYAFYLNWARKYKPLKISKNITEKTLAMINENHRKFPGASIIVEPKRVYKDIPYFSHILGYTKKISAAQLDKLKAHNYNAFDIVGQVGIEKQMELYLRGTDGKQTVEVDSSGRTRNVIETVDAQPGKDVFLTIDRELQISIYNALEKQIANVVISNLTQREPAVMKRTTILLREIYGEMFSNNVISIEKLESSAEGEHQKRIYNSFLNYYNSTVKAINDALIGKNNIYSEELNRYLDYIIDNLVKNGILLTRTTDENGKKKKRDAYTKFLNGQMSIYEFLNESIADGSILLDMKKKEGESPSNIELYNYTTNYINDKLLNRNTFRRYMLKNMAKEEKFSYTDLSMLLIEQGVVSSDDSEQSNLVSGRLSPLTFMKNKIASLELKPSQVAQDPSTGSAVVVDVNTGEVRAMVSYPGYDNNRLVNNFDNNYYYQLLFLDPTEPLIHRATKEKKAPGSVFKMISAMAGLEEGVITKDTIINGTGVFDKIRPPISCWIYRKYGRGHGEETVAEALRDSCNYFFNEVGVRLGTDDEGNYIAQLGTNKLLEYIGKFGLDTRSGIEFEEYEPGNPTGDPARAAMGQQDNDYSPIQLARYITTLANGGTNYELNVVNKISEHNGTIYEERTPKVATVSEFNPANLQTVYSGMLMVTSPGGTAASIFKDLPIKVAGKTGTAQQTNLRPDHATFTAFAPYDNPEIAIVVNIPFGDTAQNAGKVVKDIIEQYYDLGGTTNTITMDNVFEQ